MSDLYIAPIGEWGDGRVRALRWRLGLTQGQMAQVLGVTRITITRWETGSRPITHDRGSSVRRLLDCLDEHPEWFLEWEEERDA